MVAEENDGAGEVQGAVTGIINPPPDLRLIVDKTARFVAKNGKVFESRILQKNDKDLKFGFLRPNNPYHKYYQAKVDELALQIHKEQQEKEKASESDNNSTEQNLKTETEEKEENIQTEKKEITAEAEADISKAPKLKLVAKVSGNKKERESRAPPDFQFLLKHPDVADVTSEVTPAKLEIIKVTAQYTAAIGRSLLSKVALKEVSNPDFDFLKPSHKHFTYFTSLVDSYHKIIDAKKRKATIETLEKLFKDRLTVLDRCVHRVEWKQQQEQKERETLANDKSDQIAFLQIDWHDFVIVETINFDDGEALKTGASANGTAALSSIVKGSDIETNQKDDGNESDDMDMDMDMDMGETSDTEEKLDVRKDYVPAVSTGEERSKMVTLPDGRRIAADDLNEHVRVELIDPQARENRKKFMERQQKVPFANRDISSNLAKLASHRPDVFGIDEEVAEKEREEAEKKRKETQAVIWDGSTNTVSQVTIAAQLNKERRQQHELHSGAEAEGSGIGPSLSRPPVPPNIQRQQPPIQPMVPPPHIQALMMPPPGAAPIPPVPPVGAPPMGAPPMFPPPGMPPPSQTAVPQFIQPPGSAPVPTPIPGVAQPLVEHLQPTNVEHLQPPSKKPKLSEEPQVLDEEEFAAKYPGKVALNIKISEPNDQWNLTPQNFTVELPSISSSILEVKQQILSVIATTLPVGKFQLKSSISFMKDKQTLAQANIAPGSSLELKVKQRGGRR